ncbi:M20/M25/M40 family metallo-hydrolase [Streptomyces sp. 372A]
MIEDLRQAAQVRTASVVELASELIRRPSRAGIDDYGPVLTVLEDWLAARVLPHRRLHGATGALVGLLVEVPGSHPGPWWTLDACVDTAPYGDESAWSFPPACGDVVDGWLRGRGAADSKLAAAMFCHIAADLAPRAAEPAGGLAVLLDVDEHTGGFGGARAYLTDRAAPRPAGVMIGYPGMDEVVVGGRGLWRAVIAVHAPSGHSGSSKTVIGAITRRRPPRTASGHRRTARRGRRLGVSAGAEAVGHCLPRRPGLLRHPRPGRHQRGRPHRPRLRRT